MKIIGRFVVTLESTNKQYCRIDTYDATLTMNDEIVHQCAGCVGKKSGEFWASYLEEKAMKLNILLDRLETHPEEKDLIEKWIGDMDVKLPE